jgi:hypothetical protein
MLRSLEFLNLITGSSASMMNFSGVIAGAQGVLDLLKVLYVP